jgi:hypothetical protein
MNKTEYNKEYYKKNKKKIAAAKKQRYEDNGEYRRSLLFNSKVQYALRSLKEDKPIEYIKFNGTQERAYSLKQVIKIINRSKPLVYSWYKNGIIPKSLFGNDRLCYSQVAYIDTILDKIDSGALSISYEQLGIILNKVWNKKFSTKVLQEVIKEIMNEK